MPNERLLIGIVIAAIVFVVFICGLYARSFSKFYEKKYGRSGVSYPIAGWTFAFAVYFCYLYPGYAMLNSTFAFLGLVGGLAFTRDFMYDVKKRTDVSTSDKKSLCLCQVLMIPGIVVVPLISVVSYAVRILKRACRDEEFEANRDRDC